ncbi:hypothetical protein VC253_01375 [Xanthomonas campestris]|uniref:hypothetical protein n=1 Tax=Xanthomonas campestris TaxID=339 RepID=UPI002B22992F|nr:hypothetical protein [Xanthomonas campestris]MEA9550513.1 hypothetical protein [Xanthomonas campestris]
MSRHNTASLSELVAQAHAARGRMLALEAARASCSLRAAALSVAAALEFQLSTYNAKEQIS